MYLLSMLTLLAVLVVGTKIFGSRRWIPILGFTFQISEFVKLVLILLVARYLTEIRSETLDGIELLKLSGLIGLPMLLVKMQPDLGTALTYLPILAVGVDLAGLRREFLGVVWLLGGFGLPVRWDFLEQYRNASL